MSDKGSLTLSSMKESEKREEDDAHSITHDTAG
jgi:hypothetical protein